MARLPIPGSDDGTWGNLLNDYLRTEHNADGTHPDSLKNPDWSAIASKPTTFAPSNHTHDKAEVGLGNVDNTSDMDKQAANDARYAALSHAHTTSQISDATATGKSLLQASTSSTALTSLGVNTSLASWFKGDISTKKVAFIGDSTTDLASNHFYGRLFHVTLAYNGDNPPTYFPGYYASAYGPLSGMTMADDRDSLTSSARPQNFTATNIVNLGRNGQTMAVWLSTYAAAETSIGADLFVFCYGINDVRVASQPTLNTLISQLRQAITLMKTNSPGCCILLRMPNSFLADDPGNTGYVSTTGYGSLAAAAQAKTDLLFNAYTTVARDNVDAVVLIDTQTTIFGRTVKSAATNAFMLDILHPNGSGQAAIADAITALIGRAPLYSQALADAARTTSYSAPYSLYYRAVEDSNYWHVIASGCFNSGGTNYLDILWPSGRAAEIQTGDVVAIEGYAPFVLTGTAGAFNTFTRMAGMTFPVVPPSTYGGTVTVYRHKYLGDANIETYWKATLDYPYRWRGTVSAGGNEFLILNPAPNEMKSVLRTAVTVNDTIVCAGQTPLVLTGATFTSFNTDYLRINKSGFDFSSWPTGSKLAVFGNHAYEDGSAYRRVHPDLQLLQIN